MTISRFAALFVLSLAFFMPVNGSIVWAQDNTTYEKELMEAHKKMMDDMMMKSTGDPDKDFAMMMIPHHQGAIDMAGIELKYGKDPMLKKMAQEIIDAQKKEIDEFKKWQGEHN